MQYLRWRQSSVKRRKTGEIITVHSFVKYFSFFERDFFFVVSFRTILGYTPTKRFFGAYNKAYSRKS